MIRIHAYIVSCLCGIGFAVLMSGVTPATPGKEVRTAISFVALGLASSMLLGYFMRDLKKVKVAIGAILAAMSFVATIPLTKGMSLDTSLPKFSEYLIWVGTLGSVALHQGTIRIIMPIWLIVFIILTVTSMEFFHEYYKQ
jgi:hypothetical protein